MISKIWPLAMISFAIACGDKEDDSAVDVEEVDEAEEAEESSEQESDPEEEEE